MNRRNLFKSLAAICAAPLVKWLPGKEPEYIIGCDCASGDEWTSIVSVWNGTEFSEWRVGEDGEHELLYTSPHAPYHIMPLLNGDC
jgi:hypothetical protein